jgi:pimeloyl-ACP methyl ester carboxylesterase
MRMERRTVDVDGTRVCVLEVGTGEPLLFLHGWGLSPEVYAEGLRRVAADGVRVIAPALPGFGGSDSPARLDLAGYAETIARLLELMGVLTPVLVVGHSFGGGVALQLATDRPERVRSLTLVNSVGGAPGRRSGLIDASWLHWALGAVTELSPTAVLREAPGVLRAFLPCALRRPRTLARTAALALRASLADQAAALVERGLPVLFVWADEDRLIAPGALAHVAASLPPRLVQGKHGWLITEPDEFATVVHDALAVHAAFERGQRGLPLQLGGDASLGDLLPHERRSGTRTSASSAPRAMAR